MKKLATELNGFGAKTPQGETLNEGYLDCIWRSNRKFVTPIVTHG